MEATSNIVVNFLKLDEITQGPDENPTMFLNRLTEALIQYTRLAPDSPAGAVTLASCFISQSTPDIRKKLAKANEGPQTPIRDLFPLSQPNLRGLKPIIDRLLGQGLLVPTSSPCNTPILLVQPLPDPDMTMFVNGSSKKDPDGRRAAAYAVVTLQKVLEAQALPLGTTSQKAELTALTRALHLAKNKRANIYTDSKQVIQTVHRSCLTCATISPQGGLRPPQETHQLRGHLPGQDWQITQQVAAALNITWHLHIPYRPQSSDKVERANGVLKAHLAKLTSEVRLSWVDLLPLAPTRIRTTPHSKTGLTPFELLYGWPYMLTHLPPEKPPPLANYLPLFTRLRALLREHADRVLPQPRDGDGPIRPLSPGDQVLLKTLSPRPLQPRWTGPYTVVLTTPTAAKLSGLEPWYHVTRLKRTPPDLPEREPGLDSGPGALPGHTYQSSLTGPTKLKISRTPFPPAIRT
ncbi:uncharacterized protein [Odocoileus virginianus]|uniref:Uncharacterized protein n=1 Tax=Odocoileus virginianus TaxID=9874 RepID=A0ABM4HLK5_ODOVR